MSRFYIHRLKNSRGLVIDLQADLLADLKTRVVAPLLMSDQFKEAIRHLTPVFIMEDNSYFVAIHLMSAIPLAQIGDMMLDASLRADELTRAIGLTPSSSYRNRQLDAFY